MQLIGSDLLVKNRYRKRKPQLLADLHIYFGVALAGLVSFLSPCVLPLVPPYLGYLGGTSIDELSAKGGLESKAYRRLILASLCFVAGFTTVFIGLGAGASVFGQMVREYKAIIETVAGIVIILFGLHFLGVFRIAALYTDTRFQIDMPGSTFAGAYVMGLAFAAGWTPCIGPILAPVFALAATQETLATGVSLLLVYSLGLGIPFILAAVAIRPFLSFMHRFKKHMGRVEQAMGILLIVTGVMFLTGTINWFGQSLQDTFPALANIESWFTSETLKDDILRKGKGP